MKSDPIAVIKLSTFPLPTLLLKSILFLSMNALTILVVFAERSAVGTVVFGGLPRPSSAIDAFVVSLTFAFTGALSALLIPQRPLLATFCCFYSVAAMASALLLLIWALYQTLTHGKGHY